MAVTELSYPVTGTTGNYQNIFPSQKPVFFQVQRKDIGITSISSGTDGVVRLEANASFNGIIEGQFVTWQSDGYSLRSSRVIAIISATTIEVDDIFDSSNASNGFINYFRNWFLEIRYVRANSSSDDQDAILLLDDFSQIPSAKNGLVNANIGLPANLISPDFDIQTGLAANLFSVYKIQYRQSWQGNRTESWISPDKDVPIMLVHSTVFDLVGFTDVELTKRYVRGYPLIYSFTYSSVNDNDNNQITFTLVQRGIDKEVITSNQIASVINLNGVYLIALDTSTLDAETAFITFESSTLSSSAQYEPNDYDTTQYQ
jgi:hypothetical protein